MGGGELQSMLPFSHQPSLLFHYSVVAPNTLICCRGVRQVCRYGGEVCLKQACIMCTHTHQHTHIIIISDCDLRKNLDGGRSNCPQARPILRIPLCKPQPLQPSFPWHYNTVPAALTSQDTCFTLTAGRTSEQGILFSHHRSPNWSSVLQEMESKTCGQEV